MDLVEFEEMVAQLDSLCCKLPCDHKIKVLSSPITPLSSTHHSIIFQTILVDGFVNDACTHSGLCREVAGGEE